MLPFNSIYKRKFTACASQCLTPSPPSPEDIQGRKGGAEEFGQAHMGHLLSAGKPHGIENRKGTGFIGLLDVAISCDFWCSLDFKSW